MNLFLLDAGGAFFASGLMILFMLLAVLLETVVMILMKYNTRFKKAFLDSLLVNIITLIVGFALLATTLFDSYDFLNLLALFAITVIVEFVFLYVLNREKKPMRTLWVVVLMNMVTYLLLFAITTI